MYVTSNKQVAEAVLKGARLDGEAEMFGVHHYGEMPVRSYGPGQHPGADQTTIAQSIETYRIPNTQYESLVLAEMPTAPSGAGLRREASVASGPIPGAANPQVASDQRVANLSQHIQMSISGPLPMTKVIQKVRSGSVARRQ
jgi:hypothetical protein